jgi:hypothetical protein
MNYFLNSTYSDLQRLHYRKLKIDRKYFTIIAPD